MIACLGPSHSAHEEEVGGGVRRKSTVQPLSCQIPEIALIVNPMLAPDLDSLQRGHVMVHMTDMRKLITHGAATFRRGRRSAAAAAARAADCKLEFGD